MHRLITKQQLPIDIDFAWDFFSSPKNLSLITPPEMNFVIKTVLPEKMYAGMFIEYKVSPLLGIPLTWVTEITHVREKEFFVDEQRVGPYKIWHHQHHFKITNNGVEMTDILDYKLPAGILGKLINKLYIGKKVNSIFDYRRKKLIELFGECRK
jgi:ligand-binding SRPBCC domain-containing protein